MRKLLSAAILLLTFVSGHIYSQESSKAKIFLIEIKQDIDKSSMRKVNMGIKDAVEKGSDYLILDINTYGGAVDAADSMRTAVIQCPIPVIAFINVQAASAGALISIACDSIYMRNGSTFGAATVVNQNGEVMPDKYQSFMRGMMRATAESHGKKIIMENGVEKEVWHRDPQIAQQMTDTANVLSFTPEEAIANRYCEGMADSVEEVIAMLGVGEYELEEQVLTWLDKVVLFLLSPILQGIFLILIVGGIYFELQSPGVGFPLAAAIFGALLYFAPLYLYGLALNWEIVAFVIGVILLILEIFVTPGFGVLGVSGIILMFASLVFAMIDNDLLYYNGSMNFSIVVRPLLIVFIGTLTGLILSIWGVAKLYPRKSFSYIAQKAELKGSEGWVGVETDSISKFVGMETTAFTDLHPTGKLLIEGKSYEAIMEFGSAAKGDKIKITRFEGGRLYCEKIG